MILSSRRKTKFYEKKGFTLPELLMVTALIGILAAVVLVSMSHSRKRAREARVLGSISSAVAAMQTCWMHGGEVNRPTANENTGGNDICDGRSSYGQWPRMGQSAGLGYSGYASSYIEGTPPDEDDTDHIDQHSWFVRVTLVDDTARVCCNSAMRNCVILKDSGEDCDENTPG